MILKQQKLSSIIFLPVKNICFGFKTVNYNTCEKRFVLSRYFSFLFCHSLLFNSLILLPKTELNYIKNSKIGFIETVILTLKV